MNVNQQLTVATRMPSAPTRMVATPVNVMTDTVVTASLVKVMRDMFAKNKYNILAYYS